MKGKPERLSYASQLWYLASLAVFICLAIAASLERRPKHLAKGGEDSFIVIPIATKVFNPAPSIELKVTSAEWCLPCKKLKTHLEELKKRGYSIQIYDLGDPRAPKPKSGVPHLRWERFGKVAKEEAGYQSRETLEKTFKELEGVIFD